MTPTDLSREAWAAIHAAAALVGYALVKPAGTWNGPLTELAVLARARPAARKAYAEAEALWWRMATSGTGLQIARREAFRARGPVPLEDLVTDGVIGVFRAARTFEPERGLQFATYSRWWARAEITRAIDQGGRPIRATSAVVRVLIDHRRLPPGLTRLEEARAIGVTLEALESALAIREVRSLSAPARRGGLDDFRTFEDALSLEAEPVAHVERIDEARDLARVTGALWRLDARTRNVLERHLLDGASYATVAAEVGLSRERVRQIEADGIRRIREALGIRDDEHMPLAAK